MSRIDEGGVEHARLSASESKRWLNCPGSVAACENAGEGSSTFAANEGTCAHHLLNRCLHELKAALDAQRVFTSEVNAVHFLGHTVNLAGDWLEPGNGPDPGFGEVFTFTINQEMADAVQVAIDYVIHRVQEKPGARLLLEHRFNLGWIRPDMFGTADVNIIWDFDELEVVDYKHGRGVIVEMRPLHIGVDERGQLSVGGNTQVPYYAVGCLNDEGWDFATVRGTIVQPRARHADGPIRSLQYEVDALRQYAKTLGEGADNTRSPNAWLRAGDWCGFCAAAATCKELRERAYEAAALDFSAVGTPEVDDPEQMDDWSLTEAVRSVGLVEGWCRAVRRAEATALKAGREIEGRKLVMAITHRKWANEEQAEKHISRITLTPRKPGKLLSPSQVERLPVPRTAADPEKWRAVRAAIVSQLAVRPPGGLTVVDADDPREAISLNQAAAADFADVEMEE